jgi:hypothetical protein
MIMCRILYLTYADPPTEVFSSQVCDVVNFLKNHLQADIRLVAFVSVRHFFSARTTIRSEVGDAIVLPMLPKANYWGCSLPLLLLVCLMTGAQAILARGVLACNLALWCRQLGLIKKVGYDGRGAIAAEWHEYEVVTYRQLKKSIDRLEKKAVLNSDFRIAISTKLVDYWQQRYEYKSDRHVIIPCLLHTEINSGSDRTMLKTEIRKKYNLPQQASILAYAGSVAGWQSFGLIRNTLSPILHESEQVVLLFLSPPSAVIDAMQKQFPRQVLRYRLPHQEALALLSACDYGLVIREPSVTNRVAAPTKFAEYLNAGLPVIISEGIGDYSDFVRNHRCGVVLEKNQPLSVTMLGQYQSEEMKSLARQSFTKETYRSSYQQVLKTLCT